MVSGDDPIALLARDPFVARCLRRLLAGERGAATLLSAGVSPTARRQATRGMRVRSGGVAAYRQGRVAQPAALDDWRGEIAAESDDTALRRRYPLVLALLRELTTL
jgi:hypothetical protein